MSITVRFFSFFLISCYLFSQDINYNASINSNFGNSYDFYSFAENRIDINLFQNNFQSWIQYEYIWKLRFYLYFVKFYNCLYNVWYYKIILSEKMNMKIIKATSKHTKDVGRLFDLYRQFYKYKSIIK